MLKDGNFIGVQAFMVRDLKLKGNELLVYAIIYGFSQDGENNFEGSLKYLCEWTNASKKTIMNTLQSLVDKDLIIKQDIFINGVKFCKYRCKNYTEGGVKITTGWCKNYTEGGEKITPNNIDNNINNNINNNIDSAPKRFTPPTLEEVQAYCKERNNNVDAIKFINYYEANGWKVGRNKMKNWQATVRTWERNNFDKPTTKRKALVNAYDDSLDDIL